MQREFGLIVNDDCFRFTRFSFLKTGLAWEAGLLIKFNTMKLGKFWPVPCSVLYTTSHLSGQSDENLFQQLKRMDSLLFEVCFNQCRVDELLPYISQDLEFYHDQSGVMESRDQFMESVRTNICANMDFKPIRKLNEASLQIFPLFNQGKLYGVIQQGVHTFYIREPQKELYETSEAKFIHLWLWQNDRWMLKRVLSYDHIAAN